MTFEDHWKKVLSFNPALEDNPFLRPLVQAAWDAAVTECSNCIPTNWLDPLLTGPNAVVGNLGAHNVEAILKAVKERIIERSNVDVTGLALGKDNK